MKGNEGRRNKRERREVMHMMKGEEVKGELGTETEGWVKGRGQ